MGLLWGRVAYYFGLLGFPGKPVMIRYLDRSAPLVHPQAADLWKVAALLPELGTPEGIHGNGPGCRLTCRLCIWTAKKYIYITSFVHTCLYIHIIRVDD